MSPRAEVELFRHGYAGVVGWIVGSERNISGGTGRQLNVTMSGPRYMYASSNNTLPPSSTCTPSNHTPGLAHVYALHRPVLHALPPDDLSVQKQRLLVGKVGHVCKHPRGLGAGKGGLDLAALGPGDGGPKDERGLGAVGPGAVLDDGPARDAVLLPLLLGERHVGVGVVREVVPGVGLVAEEHGDGDGHDGRVGVGSGAVTLWVARREGVRGVCRRLIY